MEYTYIIRVGMKKTIGLSQWFFGFDVIHPSSITCNAKNPQNHGFFQEKTNV
jgi:hypothetical protein